MTAILFVFHLWGSDYKSHPVFNIIATSYADTKQVMHIPFRLFLMSAALMNTTFAIAHGCEKHENKAPITEQDIAPAAHDSLYIKSSASVIESLEFFN